MTPKTHDEPELDLDRLVRLMREGTDGMHAGPRLLGAVRTAEVNRRRRRSAAAGASAVLACAAVAGALALGAPRPDRLSVADGPAAQSTAPIAAPALGPDDGALRAAEAYTTTWRQARPDGTVRPGDSTTTRSGGYAETTDGQATGQLAGPRLRYGLLTLTWQQVLDLPQDRDALRARLAEAGVDQPGELFATGPQLLATAPLLQPTRLALVDLLREAPGARVGEDARDTAGRTGLRLSFGGNGNGSYVLIIDRSSGRLLEEADRRGAPAGAVKTWLTWTARGLPGAQPFTPGPRQGVRHGVRP